MSKDLVRCGVIGAGWWATAQHIPALKKHPKAELIAVQRRQQERADKVAQDFDIPHAFTTAEKLIALDDLDAVIISSTPNVHYSQTKAALERGLHVLIEKPMTIKLDQSRAMSFSAVVKCPYSRYACQALRVRSPNRRITDGRTSQSASRHRHGTPLT